MPGRHDACVMFFALDAGSRNRCSAGIHDRSSEDARTTVLREIRCSHRTTHRNKKQSMNALIFTPRESARVRKALGPTR